MDNDKIVVGDIVRSKVNELAADIRYRVIKTLKTVCWIQILPEHGIKTMEGGKTVIECPVYKNVRYSSIEKVRSAK